MKFPIRKTIGSLILAGTIGTTFVSTYFHLFEKQTVFSVNFFRGEQLEKDADLNVQEAANFLMTNPGKAKIIGFAKPGDDAAADMKLSLDRANNISTMLQVKGISPNRLIVIGNGGTKDGSARVDIVIVK